VLLLIANIQNTISEKREMADDRREREKEVMEKLISTIKICLKQFRNFANNNSKFF